MVNYQYGEELARKCLEANGFYVIDRRNQPIYWRKDIDLTAIKGNYSADIEVKWDQKISTSGAMFFELLTNIQENQLGWANYTQCDYVFYGDAQKLVFYIFRAEDMRDYLKNHKDEYETKVANDYNYRDGTIYKQSLGAIVPLANFRIYYQVQTIDIGQRLGLNQF